MTVEEERIALFLDYENLAIGARDKLGGATFDFRPIAEALAERGRVVVRRAYADWSCFRDDRRMLTRHQVELIDIPQRLGVRKNAADIKMAVDAMELCFERDYLTTFVICTGDSDFTPLVHKLRALNKRVIGVGIRASTSPLLPPACDEFLFYEALEGVEAPAAKPRRAARRKTAGAGSEVTAGSSPGQAEQAASAERQEAEAPQQGAAADLDELTTLVRQTLAGLQRGTGVVLGSMLKRALLRKDPTFSEATYGFRTWSEMLRYLEQQKVVELSAGGARGDPEVSLPEQGTDEPEAFELLARVVAELEAKRTLPLMSGLKDRLRKRQPSFSEKRLGYGGFLQFCKAAQTRGVVRLEWSDEAEDYVLHSV